MTMNRYILYDILPFLLASLCVDNFLIFLSDFCLVYLVIERIFKIIISDNRNSKNPFQDSSQPVKILKMGWLDKTTQTYTKTWKLIYAMEKKGKKLIQ